MTSTPPHLTSTLYSLHFSGCENWKFKQSGLFTVNFLYRSLTGYYEENYCFRWIWTTKTSLKIKVHMCLSFHECLLTTENLAKRGVHFTLPCLLCGTDPEIVTHIFLQCFFTAELWASERNSLPHPFGLLPLHLFGGTGGHLTFCSMS